MNIITRKIDNPYLSKVCAFCNCFAVFGKSADIQRRLEYQKFGNFIDMTCLMVKFLVVAIFFKFAEEKLTFFGINDLLRPTIF